MSLDLRELERLLNINQAANHASIVQGFNLGYGGYPPAQPNPYSPWVDVGIPEVIKEKECKCCIYKLMRDGHETQCDHYEDGK